MDPAGGDIKGVGYKRQRLAIQISKGLLDGVQGFDEGITPIAVATHCRLNDFPAHIIRWKISFGLISHASQLLASSAPCDFHG